MSDRIGSELSSAVSRSRSNYCSRGCRPRSDEGLVNAPGLSTPATALTTTVILNPAEGEA